MEGAQSAYHSFWLMVVNHQPVYNKGSELPMESENERIEASV